MDHFLETYRNELLRYLIGDMPAHMKMQIAVMLQSSSLFPSEWRESAYRMGIQDNYTLDKIEAASEVSREMPLYIAMNLLNDSSIIQLFDALQSMQRYDILRLLEPYARARVEMLAEE